MARAHGTTTAEARDAAVLVWPFVDHRDAVIGVEGYRTSCDISIMVT